MIQKRLINNRVQTLDRTTFGIKGQIDVKQRTLYRSQAIPKSNDERSSICQQLYQFVLILKHMAGRPYGRASCRISADMYSTHGVLSLYLTNHLQVFEKSGCFGETRSTEQYSTRQHKVCNRHPSNERQALPNIVLLHMLRNTERYKDTPKDKKYIYIGEYTGSWSNWVI